jgi:hypothetical protein
MSTRDYPDHMTIAQAAGYISETTGRPRTVNAVRKLLHQVPDLADARVNDSNDRPVLLDRAILDAWMRRQAVSRPERESVCPYCAAPPGRACQTRNGTPLSDNQAHYARVNACPTCHAPPGARCTGTGRTLAASTLMHPSRSPHTAAAAAAAPNRAHTCPHCRAKRGHACTGNHGTHTTRIRACTTCGVDAGKACKPGGTTIRTPAGEIVHTVRPRRDIANDPYRNRNCPTCGASPGQPCRTPAGNTLVSARSHSERREAWTEPRATGALV